MAIKIRAILFSEIKNQKKREKSCHLMEIMGKKENVRYFFYIFYTKYSSYSEKK
jgi:hypothetical protein